MENNVKCTECNKEWCEANIKTINTKTHNEERIAFLGGKQGVWLGIKCTTPGCKGIVVRVPPGDVIEDHQLNKFAARNDTVRNK